tara:strand:- start:141176 stop:141787 length:612 start_codon:yes stop_codon:yes gene_type:complete
MIDRECPVCGTVFQVAEHRLKHGRGINCSKECQYIANREKLAKEKVKLTCIGCGAEFERLNSWLDKGKGMGKFCTRECRDANWKGDITPNWQGGNGVYKRGPHWQSIKRAILKRDNYECQECCATGDLHVHHKVPFRMFDDADVANHEDNLISLCPPCHRKADAAHKWAKAGDAIIRMGSGSYAWELARKMMANDNLEQRAAA